MKLKFNFVQGGSQTINNYEEMNYVGGTQGLLNTIKNAKNLNEEFALTSSKGEIIKFKGNDLFSIEFIL
ncbi:hypothetical protein M3172_08830 [Mesobacillus subterraneus]|uniref:hypothetical protein n=1 Tax=Mesobacillus subterraneus TaxID=285983 RepID=UPI00203E8263|nr:hypothetical protein [Mesobacillus subterraneus]MCM3573298.1 hypothetical protein [Mesobacillus subterraneus]